MARTTCTLDTPEFIPIERAIAESDISRATIFRRIRAGEIATMRDGADRRRLLVSRRDVRRSLEPQPLRRIA